MKLIEAFSTAALFLLPLSIAPAYAQNEHEQEKAPQEKQQQSKPAQQQSKPAQHQAKPAPQHAQQQPAKPAQRPQQAARPQQAKPVQQQQRAQHPQAAKPAQQGQQASRSQPAASHGRIPDDRFRASFGREHSFHVNRSDFEGSRRFQYGGFWFNVLDPWPAGWLYTDNVYVDYINGGYFLCDPVHPGVYISISVG